MKNHACVACGSGDEEHDNGEGECVTVSGFLIFRVSFVSFVVIRFVQKLGDTFRVDNGYQQLLIANQLLAKRTS